MSDDDIKRAVAPFWRCPDCGSKGTPYVAELDALRAENARLRAARKEIAELLTDAAVGDCENGVQWLNEQAAANYLHEYPDTKKAIDTVLDSIRREAGDD